jgi:TonB family protein
MIRIGILMVACVAALLLCAGRATASVEFCPAVLGNMSPIGAPPGPSATYSYELTAQAPRSVDASLIADTTAGWFGWSVAGVQLHQTTRFLRSTGVKRYGLTFPPVTIPYPTVASDPLSVTFASPLTVRHAWVVAANGSGACDVPDFPTASMADPPPVYPGNFVTPSPLPSPSTPSARALPTSPPFAPESCDTPFVEAKVTRPAIPEFPMSAREEGFAGTSVVEVAVGKDGKLIDAWTLGSSGSRAIDLSAIHAARASEYTKPVSYCRPVNGLYLFRADFLPG